MNAHVLCLAMATVAAFAISAATATAAGDVRLAEGAESIGSVDFRVSCDESVRADFDRGLAYLHHMMYVEARGVFESIAAKDSECAMAHWGIAATLFQPLWPTRPGPEELEQGRREVARALELEPGSDREAALVEAANAFFRDPEADWWTRIRRWAASMEKAHAAHPEDHDIAAFRALSRLAVGPVSDDRLAENAAAAEILLGIHAENPKHPGAVHYTIHANDVDGRADRSLDVVRSYGGIAPGVPHALHMPTHVFVRLGAWDEVIDWNEKSAAAALRFPAGDAVSHHYAHAVDYLVYARLQRGEDEAAAALAREALAKGEYQPSFISAFHLAAIPARLAVERRAWKEAAAIEPRQPESIPWEKFPWAESLSWAARGLGAAHTGDVEKAREAERRMAALRDRADEAGEKGFATYIEIDRRVLAGRIAHAAGDSKEALELLRSAAELESTVQKHPVSPGALIPAREALGDLLLELDQPAEALDAYRASERVWPERRRTRAGITRAERELEQN